MRTLLIAAGVLALLLAALGMVLPLLPSTPFLLLAAGCFSRSSSRLHRWLLQLPWAGQVIDDYANGRGVSARSKASALLLLWTSMAVTAGTMSLSPWALALLLFVASAVSCFIVCLKAPGSWRA